MNWCIFRWLLSHRLQFVVEPSRDKLLPDPLKPPYWQPKYTVVIELKNVLVTTEWSVSFKS